MLYQKNPFNNKISKYQLVLYDFNNEILDMERIHNYLKELTYTNKEIKKFLSTRLFAIFSTKREGFDTMQTINDVLYFSSQNLQ